MAMNKNLNNNNFPKFRNANNDWYKPSDFFVFAGNGKAIPQFYKDKQDKDIAKPLIDEKTGKQVMRNMFAEIQESRLMNDYRRILAMGGDVPASQYDPSIPVTDLSEFGQSDELLQRYQFLREKLGDRSIKDVIQDYINDKYAQSQAMAQDQAPSQTTSKSETGSSGSMPKQEGSK